MIEAVYLRHDSAQIISIIFKSQKKLFKKFKKINLNLR
jgi:hypothetical protein